MISTGRIAIVGIGPGSLDHMTPAARAAIDSADTVIGYVTYLRLIEELLDGKTVIRKAMAEELGRAEEALARAQQGERVALISSGDAGVYGMAGPTYEVLFEAGWTPESGIDVEVIPGTSALVACAARVGAPLTHDFCAISLSDLLTPWAVIARRLDAVGAADFVVAFYNPKSGRRSQQILEAQRILLRHRSPDTPVAIVKSAFRPRERIELSTLGQMAECEIGMLSTVLIGNSHTFVRSGQMVTPRGYANKYDVASGTVFEGEQAGRSLSTGLTGWREALAASGETAESLAAVFNLPLAEILRLREGATLSPEEILAWCARWAEIRLTLFGPASRPTLEVRARAADMRVAGGELAVDLPGGSLRLPWPVPQATLSGQTLYAMNSGGEVLCRIDAGDAT